MARWLTRRRVLAAILVVAGLVAAARVEAQFGRSFRSLIMARPADYDGTFQFCRVMFAGDPRGDSGGWDVDWPRADINLSIRLSELTKTLVGKARTGDPHHLLLRLTDEALFKCPFIMMTEVGDISLSDDDVERLKEYFAKGGFLWADDFWGSYAWDWWEAQIRKVFPASQYQIIDVPLNHPLYRSQFEMKNGAPQISAIGRWQAGVLSERGEDSKDVHVRAIVDSHDRVMVLITHNTDFGDSYEREGDNPDYFYEMSVPGYAFGINTILYAMTH